MRRKNDELNKQQRVKEEAQENLYKLREAILKKLEKSIDSGENVSEVVEKFKNLSKDLMSSDSPAAAGGDLPRRPVYLFGNDSPPPQMIGRREGFGVFPKPSSISDYPAVDSEVRMEPQSRAVTPKRENRPFASSIRSGYAAIGDLSSQEPGFYLKPDEPDESNFDFYGGSTFKSKKIRKSKRRRRKSKKIRKSKKFKKSKKSRKLKKSNRR